MFFRAITVCIGCEFLNNLVGHVFGKSHKGNRARGDTEHNTIKDVKRTQQYVEQYVEEYAEQYVEE